MSGPHERSSYSLYREYMRLKYGPGPWVNVDPWDKWAEWDKLNGPEQREKLQGVKAGNGVPAGKPS